MTGPLRPLELGKPPSRAFPSLPGPPPGGPGRARALRAQARRRRSGPDLTRRSAAATARGSGRGAGQALRNQGLPPRLVAGKASFGTPVRPQPAATRTSDAGSGRRLRQECPPCLRRAGSCDAPGQLQSSFYSIFKYIYSLYLIQKMDLGQS